MRLSLSQFTEDPRQRYAPVRLLESKRPANPAAVESRISGSRCLCRIVLAADGHKPGHWRTRARKNRVGELVPTGARRTGKMIRAPSRKARPTTGHRHRQDGIGDITCFGRTAELICDDAQLAPLASKPQHCLDEIGPVDAEHP